MRHEYGVSLKARENYRLGESSPGDDLIAVGLGTVDNLAVQYCSGVLVVGF